MTSLLVDSLRRAYKHKQLCIKFIHFESPVVYVNLFFISLASLLFYGSTQRTFLKNAIFIAHARSIWGKFTLEWINKLKFIQFAALICRYANTKYLNILFYFLDFSSNYFYPRLTFVHFSGQMLKKNFLFNGPNFLFPLLLNRETVTENKQDFNGLLRKKKERLFFSRIL